MDKTYGYYETIMDSQTSLKNHFHKIWLEYLNSLDIHYKKSMQMRIGNHLRPLLVYWGNALTKHSPGEIDVEKATEVAICVETMHKVSIVVDDLIDEDRSRHNQETFHLQYSPNEAIIFAVYMIGEAITKLNNIQFQHMGINKRLLDIFSNTFKTMAHGCLAELTLDNREFYDYNVINQIIDEETSTLIKNSFLLGQLINGDVDKGLQSLGEDIGARVGNVFQVMNDLEPFGSQENIYKHKGSLNADFNRGKKNIVVSYIFGSCTLKEQSKLLALKQDDSALDYLFTLYHKYKIFDRIMADVDESESNIFKQMDNLRQYNINHECLSDFKVFCQEIFEIGRSKLFSSNSDQIE